MCNQMLFRRKERNTLKLFKQAQHKGVDDDTDLAEFKDMLKYRLDLNKVNIQKLRKYINKF